MSHGAQTDQAILDSYVGHYGAVLSVIFGFWLLQHWRAKQLAAASASSGPDLAELPKFDDDEE